MKLLNFLEHLSEIVESLITNSEDFGKNILDKRKSAIERYKRGYSIYLEREFEIVRESVYLVGSVQREKVYSVDMKEWFCSCEDFNQNARTCKHMFYIMISISVNLKLETYKELDIKNIDCVFEWMKRKRKLFTNNKGLKNLIDYQQFPCTIGETAFLKKYAK